jgi:hypothetical protein
MTKPSPLSNFSKIDLKNLKGWEIIYWSLLLLNLTAFLFNVFTGNLFLMVLNGSAVAFMVFTLNNYYKYER